MGMKGKQEKGQLPVTKTKTEAPKGNKPVAGTLSLLKEAKDASTNSRHTTMTGLKASFNTNVSKNARKK